MSFQGTEAHPSQGEAEAREGAQLHAGAERGFRWIPVNELTFTEPLPCSKHRGRTRRQGKHEDTGCSPTSLRPPAAPQPHFVCSQGVFPSCPLNLGSPSIICPVAGCSGRGGRPL